MLPSRRGDLQIENLNVFEMKMGRGRRAAKTAALVGFAQTLNCSFSLHFGPFIMLIGLFYFYFIFILFIKPSLLKIGSIIKFSQFLKS
jgi:hypothetical protein